MINFIKTNTKKIAVAAVGVIAVAAIIVSVLTAPYAVYADGTEIYDPYVVKADDTELFLVGDAQTAENVIEAVMDEYSPEGAQINSITVDKKLTTESKKLKRGDDIKVVLTEEEAVDYVLTMNSTETPLFSVTINAEKGAVSEVKAQSVYEETDSMYQGETKVKSHGKSGSQIVTSQFTSVNGNILTTEVVDTAVVKESVSTVVYKGTKEVPKDTLRADYSGKVLGSGNGAVIARYACQFVGNRYVYGGTSPEYGADCSGFVQTIYKRFGVSLPRTASAQSYCGKGVSLSQAKAGDLVYYNGHIAIYIGGGQIVHASNSMSGIKISSVHGPGSIITIRRIVE